MNKPQIHVQLFDRRANQGEDVENQHRKIAGYRELSQAEIDLMNKIKAKGAELEELLGQVKSHIDFQYAACTVNENVLNSDEKRAALAAEQNRLNAADPDYWRSYAEGSFKTGIMYLVRAVAQPTTF